MSVPMTQQDENRFWLQVMGDKARIIQKKLHPSEPELIVRVGIFITRFDKLLEEASGAPNQGDVATEAFGTVQGFRKFLLQIIHVQVNEKSVVSILPDYLIVFTNECELYLDYLNASIQGAVLTRSGLDLALIWCLNAYFAATHVENNLSVAFAESKIKANKFAYGFLVLYLRAKVLQGFSGTGLQKFPMLDAFYNDTANHFTKYAEFVVDLIMLMEKHMFMGTLSMLELDHHYRILCYVMHKLSEVSNLRPPACDPAAPRRE